MLAVIAPMEREISYLRQDLGSPEWKGHPARPLVVGVGRLAVQNSLGRWLSRGEEKIDGLLLLGFAGAVDPELSAGDLILSGQYGMSSDGKGRMCGGVIDADNRMLKQATEAAEKAGLTWHSTDSITVDGLIATKAEKASIYQRRRFGSVNMEDYWVADLASQARVPFVSVRAVIDTAEQELPGFVMLLDHNPIGALFSAVSQPWKMPNLLRLAGNLRKAQGSLQMFSRAFLTGGNLLEAKEVGPVRNN